MPYRIVKQGSTYGLFDTASRTFVCFGSKRALNRTKEGLEDIDAIVFQGPTRSFTTFVESIDRNLQDGD